jgi:glycosyltransferase involved in cell wall biosynthesis
MVNLIDWRTMCGGAQHQLGLFGGWTAAGHDVRMLSPARNAGALPPGVPKSRLTQLASVARFKLPAALDTLVQAAVLPWLIRWHAPDLVYSRHNTFTPALVLICRLMRTPVFIEHNAWLPSQRRVDNGALWLGQLEGFGQDVASRWADGVRTVTPGIANHLSGLGVPRHRLTAVGNGTDTRRFRPLERSFAFAQFGLDPARRTVGFIGNIMPWHGLDQALDGFALAAKEFADLDLVVFGDGLGVPGLKAEAERLGLTDRVRWMGRVPLTSANAAINCLDVALLPLSARHDIGFGFSAIKLRDYAAAGRIVLTGRLPGAIELEDEPWLFTHAPDHGADLGAKLVAVLSRTDSHAQARLAARAYAEAHFDWTVICERIDAFVAARLSARKAFR